MADMNEVNGYQEYMGSMTDHTATGQGQSYEEYTQDIQKKQHLGNSDLVAREGKSDSEKKDQSRFEPNTFSSMGK